MQVGERGVQLTYCTNIHPTRGLADVRAALDAVAVPLRERLAPGRPFGVGLRLSGEESRELLGGDALRDFRAFLDGRGLYVFTMNGFPYGAFHGGRVKEDVHAPDWRDEERVAYTLRLARILAALLPRGMEGGISTSPLSYGAWVDRHDDATMVLLTTNVVRVVEELARLHASGGPLIHVDVEPEPDGLLERSDQLADFFRAHLLTRGAVELAGRLGVSVDRARDLVREHVRVCFDTCHVALMYEDPARALETYREAGMRIGKVQVSSAVRVRLPGAGEREDVRRALAPFVESTYLHQVIACHADGSTRHFPDLPDALAHLDDPDAREWRVHFHVPVFTGAFGTLDSTRDAIERSLDLLRQQHYTTHLEIETYTWDVLPPDLKLPLLDSVEREYRWVMDVL
ncbi:metabolite traffic protein EboE [Deinococcus pimensis]|uniref:metabolite traffic protein EboE n=1 Tax=Deinococcus pimensis TaxID=309888 RepID=UPI00048758B4|nr:metabolite traffic protein EboE [Deinococcus pimensis]